MMRVPLGWIVLSVMTGLVTAWSGGSSQRDDRVVDEVPGDPGALQPRLRGPVPLLLRQGRRDQRGGARGGAVLRHHRARGLLRAGHHLGHRGDRRPRRAALEDHLAGPLGAGGGQIDRFPRILSQVEQSVVTVGGPVELLAPHLVGDQGPVPGSDLRLGETLREVARRRTMQFT